MKTTEAMLTTVDNPFSPFTQFDAWLGHDTAHDHHTLRLLADVVVTSDELSESDQLRANEQGIDEILELIPEGVYIKVTQEVEIDKPFTESE